MPPHFEGWDRDGDVFTRDQTTILLVPEVEGGYLDDDGIEWYTGSTALLTATLVTSAEGALADRLDHWRHRLTVEDNGWHEKNPQQGTFRTLPPGLSAWLVEPDQEVATLLRSAADELRADVLRCIGLLRWQNKLGGPDLQAVRNANADWSLDGIEWLELPGGRDQWGVVADEIEGEAWTPGYTDATQAAFEDGASRAPLAHEILMEAITVLRSNPRAALILAITAAEVGIHHYARQASGENAAWLLSQPQSPPIDVLLKNYLPFTTQVRTHNGRVIPDGLRTILKKANGQRNDAVHGGLPAPPRQELEATIRAVRDLLYLLDWLGGAEWALQHAWRWKKEYEES